jgi:4-azaleucine resistance transporter AzlC
MLSHHLTGFKKGFMAGLPIVFGYFPVAMAFGLLSRTTGVSFRDTCLFSLLVFAGASQFMALDLIKAGVGAANIILATFLLNLRHLMMSASLSQRLPALKKPWLPLIAFGVTDETFSISSLTEEELTPAFLLALHGLPYTAWVLGSVAGYLVGTLLPPALQASFGIGLYALFAALLVPEIKKSVPVLFLAQISALIYLGITYLKLLPPGWTLIGAIIAASGLGALILKNDPQGDPQ